MILNLFRKNCYPKQTLTDKQLKLLDDLDVYLVEHRGPMGPNLSIKSIKIGLIDQMRNKPLKPEVDGYYIPRSIALVVDADGTLCLYYGIRNNDPPNELANELFIDALSRTNNARVESVKETNA